MAFDVDLKPGDLLYIPHGVYHEALAGPEHSLHLSFGVSHVTGADLLQPLMQALLREPIVPSHLPHFEDKEALRRHVSAIGEGLARRLDSDDLGELAHRLQKQRSFERAGVFDFPSRQPDALFRVRWLQLRMEQAGNEVVLVNGDSRKSLQPGLEALVHWIYQRDYFSMRSLSQAFGNEPDLRAKLGQVADLGLIEPIAV